MTKNRTGKFLLVIVVFGTMGLNAFGQENSTEQHRTALKHIALILQEKVDSSFSHEQLLLNGRLYEMPRYVPNNHPYLIDLGWNRGSITIENHQYDSIPLKYDLENDEVLYAHTSGNQTTYIKLSKPFIREFILMDRRFVHFHKEEINNPELSGGFYEILYEGRLHLLVKWNKKFYKTGTPPYFEFLPRKTVVLVSACAKTRVSDTKAENPQFIGVNEEYSDEHNPENGVFAHRLVKENHFNILNNRNDLFSIWRGKKKEIKRFLRQNRIAISAADSDTLIRLVKFCEQL